MRKLTFIVLLLCGFFSSKAFAQTVSGYVFYDENRNGIFDTKEKGVKNVPVSNLDEVVLTDKKGFFSIESKEPNFIVVTKLAYFQFPLDAYNAPKNHQRIGSVAWPEYMGHNEKIESKGTSEILYFPVYKADPEQEQKGLIIGDPQMAGDLQLGYLKKGQIPLMKNQNADFFLILGDIADYDLSLFKKEQEAMTILGIPGYRAIGNHDHETKAHNDKDASLFFENIYGPTDYSFEYNNNHFIVVDNIDYKGYDETNKKSGSYTGGLNARQMRWIANDLKYTNKEKTIIIVSHIPMTTEETRKGTIDSLFQLLSDREHVLFLAGHTHTLSSYYVENKEHTYEGVIAGAACGSWWSGPFTEYGLPYSTCMDGSPQGFFVFDFAKNGYKKQFIPAHYPCSFQIYAEYFPTSDGNFEVTANWFMGKPTDKMYLVLSNGILHEMTNYTGESLFLSRTIGMRTNADNWIPSVQPTDHLWKFELDSNKLKKGPNSVEIIGKDPQGNVFKTLLIINKQ